MSDEETLTPAERELASALGALRPAAPAIDRDRLMFRAGRASARHRRRLWQAACVVLGTGLAVALATRPRPAQTVRIVRIREAGPGPARLRPREAAPPAAVEGAPSVLVDNQYARLCDDVMRRGLDALPAPRRSATAAPLSVEQLLGTGPAEPGTIGFLNHLRLWPLGEQR